MSRRRIELFSSGLLIALAVLAFCAPTVQAQSSATLQGTVLDPQGASVATAKVTVRNLATGLERTAESDTSGNFSIPALPPGDYRVEIRRDGFRALVIPSYTLAVSTTASQNFALSVGEVAQTVEVTSAAPVVESSTITVGQVINQRTVQDIPLNGRHFVDLALLIPGTVTPPQNGFLTAPLRGQGSFQFNTAGNREDSVNFMINGINLNDMVQNQVTFQPTINTVSEFKVDNSTYSAEYGRNSGAIVNIATRSGTNEFHGEVFEFLRNDAMDARNFFNPSVSSTGTAIPQSPFKRNQFGADGGGPIWKGHTYFYLSYEGLRQRQGLTLATNVLTDANRATIQSGTNTVAKALLNVIPAANGTLNGLPAFLGSATAPVDINQGTADVSHSFSDADRLHVYYVNQHDLRREAAAGTNIPGFGDTREGQRQVLTINETHIFSNSLINELRVGANRIHITFNTNAPFDPTSFGINLGPNLPVGLPSIRISDIGLLFGGERNFPQGRGDTTYVFADTLNYIRGRHAFKFGVEFRDFRNNNFNNDPGALTFNTTTNFINGTVNTAARTVPSLGSVASRINQNALDFFAEDSFKIRPYLTLELGLRYAWNMTPSEAKDRFVIFDPRAVSLVTASEPYAQNNSNFQPRIGFAWDMFRNGKTVLRGAYALQVDQPITGMVIALSSNPPFALPISVSGAAIGSLSSSFNGLPGSVTPTNIDPNFQNASIQSWNLNIQREVTRTLGIMVGYFGSKGTHLELDRSINQFTTLGTAASRPFTALSGSSPILPGVSLGNFLTELDSSSNSSYNALWVTANKRMSSGLQFNASYTYSHSIDEISRNRQGLFVQDSTNIFGDRGSSDFDARHRFVINAIYDLPFKGNRLIEGWSVAPIVSFQSGNPFTVVLASTTITGAGNTVRPNVNGPVRVSGDPSQWIVGPSSVFSLPGNAFGNLGRNTVVGPDFKNLDLALIKKTRITERVSVQFRVDGFDLFNHPNFGQPGPLAANGATIITINPAATPAVPRSFSTISSTRFPVGDSGSARQLQVALKLIF